MRYEIKDNAVYIYNDSDIPFIHQPFNPDGLVKWSGEEEMSTWAVNFINEFIENSKKTTVIDPTV